MKKYKRHLLDTFYTDVFSLRIFLYLPTIEEGEPSCCIGKTLLKYVTIYCMMHDATGHYRSYFDADIILLIGLICMY